MEGAIKVLCDNCGKYGVASEGAMYCEGCDDWFRWKQEEGEGCEMEEVRDDEPMALIIPMSVYRRLSAISTRLKIAPSEVVERFLSTAEAVQDAVDDGGHLYLLPGQFRQRIEKLAKERRLSVTHFVDLMIHVWEQFMTGLPEPDLLVIPVQFYPRLDALAKECGLSVTALLEQMLATEERALEAERITRQLTQTK